MLYYLPFWRYVKMCDQQTYDLGSNQIIYWLARLGHILYCVDRIVTSRTVNSMVKSLISLTLNRVYLQL